MKKNLTEKEFKVLEFLIKSENDFNSYVHGTVLTDVIFDKETIKKYSHARRHKKVIETMTFSYLGRMCRKDLIWSEYKTVQNYTYYVGHYSTYKGREEYIKYLKSLTN